MTNSITKRVTALLILFIAGAMSSERASAQYASTNQVKRAVIKLDQKGHYGSGVLVHRSGSKYYFVTAAHVVDEPGKVTAYVHPDGRTRRGGFSATIIKQDSAKDVAFGYFQCSYSLPVFPIANSAYELPFRCTCSGVSDGRPDWHHVSVTSQSSLYYITQDVSTNGDSGGPLIDQSGELVGVLRGGTGTDKWCRLSSIQSLVRESGYGWLIGTRAAPQRLTTEDVDYAIRSQEYINRMQRNRLNPYRTSSDISLDRAEGLLLILEGHIRARFNR